MNERNHYYKRLTKFRDKLHTLLKEFPEIRLSADRDGDVLAYVIDEMEPRQRAYLRRSGKQELVAAIR
jgi:hypothetical protein